MTTVYNYSNLWVRNEDHFTDKMQVKY